MTQAEVLELLKKKRRWMSTLEISKEVSISVGSAISNLNRLFKQGFVLQKSKYPSRFRWNSLGNGGFLWKVK